jgi:hypothetical protein
MLSMYLIVSPAQPETISSPSSRSSERYGKHSGSNIKYSSPIYLIKRLKEEK